VANAGPDLQALFLVTLAVSVAYALIAFRGGLAAILPAFLVVLPVLNAAREVGAFQTESVILTPAMVVALLLLCAAAALDPRLRRKLESRDRWLAPTLSILLISAVVATLGSPAHLQVPMQIRAATLIDGVVIPGLLLLFLVKLGLHKGERERLSAALVISVLASIGIGVLLLQLGAGPEEAGYSEDALRAASTLRLNSGFTYGNPNTFALVAALVFPVSLWFSVHRRGVRRIVWAMSTTTLLVAGVLTFTRGLYIAVVLSVALLGFLYARFRVVAVAALLIGGVLISQQPGDEAVVTARFSQRELAGSLSIPYRLEAAALTFEVLPSYFMGVGGGGFGAVWIVDGGFPWPPLEHPHNILLAVPMEYGIAAGIAFLILMAVVLRRGFHAAIEARGGLDSGLVVGLVAFLIVGVLTGAQLSHPAGLYPLGTPTYLLAVVIALILSSPVDRAVD
jgi:hypothetical protein